VRVPIADPWPASEVDAIALQEALRGQVSYVGPAADVHLVAGLDIAYDTASDLVAGAVTLLDSVTLTVVEEATVVARAPFPYLPGLLAFREVPVLAAALEKLDRGPDLLVCDGYGVAHPRRFGLASHLGVLTGLPSIGVAKTPFVGVHGPLGDARGSTADLVDADEVVGRAVRTQDGVKPVYVSVGHRIDLDGACAWTLLLAPCYRQPETTRRADAAARIALKAALVAAPG
jgi:deoxyribonuclease V